MHIRKNFVDLTDQERNAFLAAMVTLKHTIANPGDPADQHVSIYDQFVALHGALMAVSLPNGLTVNIGHGNDLFLPWHRQYLIDLEKALQAVNPDVAIPYWDWTRGQETRNILFQDLFLGPLGTGDLHLVNSGYFSRNAPASLPAWWPNGFAGWRIRDELQRPDWRGLPTELANWLIRRGGSSALLPTANDIDLIKTASLYESFRIYLEHGAQSTTGRVIRTHDFGHNWIGGHMSTAFSPNDPVFFMHHANVDRIWAEWQENGHQTEYPAQAFPFGPDDDMWPWIGTAPGYQTTFDELIPLLPDFTGAPTSSPRALLDISSLDYQYA